MFLIAAAPTACHGGSNGGFLPSGNVSRHTQSLVQASVAQWASRDPYNPSSITVSWTNPPAAGDLLVVAFWNNGQANGVANTYTPPAGWNVVDKNTAQGYATYQSFSHVVAAGETNTYVFTPLAPVRQHVWIGADITNAASVDVSGNTYHTNSTSFAAPSVTPSNANDLALAFNMPFTTSAATWTNPAGWTVGTGPTSTWRGETLYQALSSNAPISETATLSAAATGFAAIVLVVPSGAPPPPPTPPPPTPTPPTGGTAPSISQWSSNNPYAPSSIPVSWTNPPAVGDLLVVAFWNNGQTNGAANTYSPPAGWALVDQNTSAAYATYQAFSHLVTATDASSYVFTPLSPVRQHVWIGADIRNGLRVDKAANVYVPSGTSYTTPSLTPSQTNDLGLVFNLPFTTTSLTWTNPAAWTMGTGPTTTWRGESLFQALASTGPLAESSTLSGSATGFSALALIAPGSATPTPPPTPSPAPAYTDWNTFGYNLQRTGYNPNETTLTASNVNATSLKQVWSTNLGAAITAEPLLATGVVINGVATNVLYVGAENNIFYAINADTGAILWTNTTLGSALATSCTDLPGDQFGITGTATYDKNAGIVYVADASDNVHALNMSTGVQQWAVNVLFDPNSNTTVGSTTQDHIYTALTLNPNNGMLYVGTGSFCDFIPWHGRIVAINTATQSIAAAFFPGRTTSGKSGTAYCGGGVWGMGGPSIDTTTNDVFIATGNLITTATGGCPANASGETYPYGDAVVQLDSQLNLISFATANVNGVKASGDSDYGATPMLYTVPNCSSLQLSAKNKNGYVYTYAVSPSGMTAEQQLQVGNRSSNGIFVGVPAFDPATGLVYVGNPNANGNFAHGLNALQQNAGCAGMSLAWKASIGGANVTTDDNQAPSVANGVVYFTDGVDDKLWAFNAASGAQLWNSAAGIGAPCSAYGTACGVYGAATIDGRVFVGSWNHKLYAFGL